MIEESNLPNRIRTSWWNKTLNEITRSRMRFEIRFEIRYELDENQIKLKKECLENRSIRKESVR